MKYTYKIKATYYIMHGQCSKIDVFELFGRFQVRSPMRYELITGKFYANVYIVGFLKK